MMLFRRASDADLLALATVLGLMFASGYWFGLSNVRRPIAAGISLVASDATWLRLDGPCEGRTLFVVAPGHGLTEADLLVPVVMCAAVVTQCLRRVRRKAPLGESPSR